jgi:hypothetical protein
LARDAKSQETVVAMSDSGGADLLPGKAVSLLPDPFARFLRIEAAADALLLLAVRLKNS